MTVQNNTLSDIELEAASGGQAKERHEVTLAEYERILARMIADAKKK